MKTAIVLLSIFALATAKPEPRNARATCGSTSYAKSGTIESPSYPSNYPRRTDCTSTVVASSDEVVTVTFSEFDVESATNCKYDYVSLYDGNTLRHTYCGKGSVPTFTTSPGSNFVLTFHTDGSVQKKGFALSFTVTKVAAPTGSTTGTASTGTDKPGTCGKTFYKLSLADRIVGGAECSPKHALPWQVSLQTSTGFHFCGGSIISDTYVVTAAHCVDGQTPTSWRIVLGAHNIGSNEPSQFVATVKRAKMHPSYDTSTLSNDIAIIELNEKITFTNEISPVCVSKTRIADNADVIVSGWGTLTAGGASPDTLQRVIVPTISRSECSSTVYGTGYIDSTMLCAGLMSGGKDSCQGDSGGPLVHDRSGTYYLEGVVSWGYGCADPNRPGVYARVSSLYSFLETETGITF
ncbi:Ovochymase-1 [Trichoplax sp. H2]|nr:Ovochymase-1 [Trichoplax sp. H2]|eukprot:RDD44477.1 Ovochymase-1 [Trichoplax sp. H2]